MARRKRAAAAPAGLVKTRRKKARKAKGAPRARAAPRAKAPRARKAKKPCKYGPRVNGLCPKKPSANPFATTAGVGSASEYSQALKPASKRTSTKRSPSFTESVQREVSRELTSAATKRQVKAALAPATRKLDAAVQKAAIKATGATAGASIAKNLVRIAKAPIVRGGAGAVGVGLGTAASLALVAGLGSYYGTTWILNKITKRKLTKEQLRFETSMAYRTAREDAKRQLGRELTATEHAKLAAVFKDNIAKLGG